MINNPQFTGKVISKELKKVYNKNSPFLGNLFYKLNLVIEPDNNPNYLFAYPNLVNQEIFSTIENSQYIDKRYLFFYQRKPKRLVLTD